MDGFRDSAKRGEHPRGVLHTESQRGRGFVGEPGQRARQHAPAHRKLATARTGRRHSIPVTLRAEAGVSLAPRQRRRDSIVARGSRGLTPGASDARPAHPKKQRPCASRGGSGKRRTRRVARHPVRRSRRAGRGSPALQVSRDRVSGRWDSASGRTQRGRGPCSETPAGPAASGAPRPEDDPRVQSVRAGKGAPSDTRHRRGDRPAGSEAVEGSRPGVSGWRSSAPPPYGDAKASTCRGPLQVARRGPGPSRNTREAINWQTGVPEGGLVAARRAKTRPVGIRSGVAKTGWGTGAPSPGLRDSRRLAGGQAGSPGRPLARLTGGLRAETPGRLRSRTRVRFPPSPLAGLALFVVAVYDVARSKDPAPVGKARNKCRLVEAAGNPAAPKLEGSRLLAGVHARPPWSASRAPAPWASSEKRARPGRSAGAGVRPKRARPFGGISGKGKTPHLLRRGQTVSRPAHNREIGGSIPPAATAGSQRRWSGLCCNPEGLRAIRHRAGTRSESGGPLERGLSWLSGSIPEGFRVLRLNGANFPSSILCPPSARGLCRPGRSSRVTERCSLEVRAPGSHPGGGGSIPSTATPRLRQLFPGGSA